MFKFFLKFIVGRCLFFAWYLVYCKKVIFDYKKIPSTLGGLYVASGGKLCCDGFFFCRPGSIINIGAGGELRIGHNVMVGLGTEIHCRSKVLIEDGVMLAGGVKIFDHDHVVLDGVPMPERFCLEPVTIKKGAWIGANVLILKGCTIGEFAVIGAGSVICKDVPSKTIVVQKKETTFIAY